MKRLRGVRKQLALQVLRRAPEVLPETHVTLSDLRGLSSHQLHECLEETPDGDGPLHAIDRHVRAQTDFYLG